MSELCKKITYLARDGFQGEEGRSHESNDRESEEGCQGAILSHCSNIDKVVTSYNLSCLLPNADIELSKAT